MQDFQNLNLKRKLRDFQYIYIWQRLSEDNLKAKCFNDRQIKAFIYVHENGVITLSDYSKISPEVNERILRRDLENLVRINFLKAIGEKKGRSYELAK